MKSIFFKIIIALVIAAPASAQHSNGAHKALDTVVLVSFLQVRRQRFRAICLPLMT